MMYEEPFGFDAIFTIAPILMGLMFIAVIGMIIKQAVGYAADKQKPVIPVQAKIMAKRTHVWGEHSHTTYFATFELENGERIELQIPDNQIGYMIEGDQGTLSFQGALFVTFKKG